MERFRFWVAASMIGLRFLTAGLCLAGGLVGLWGFAVLGLAELQAAILAVLNERRKVAADHGPGGLAVPLLYLVGAFVAPVGVGSQAGQGVLATIAAALIVTRFQLGAGYSVGGSTWVGLCDRGLYRVVRHPLLCLQLAARVAVFVEIPTALHLVAAIAYLGCVVSVCAIEERWLASVPAWCSYSRRVPWRLLPGVW